MANTNTAEPPSYLAMSGPDSIAAALDLPAVETPEVSPVGGLEALRMLAGPEGRALGQAAMAGVGLAAEQLGLQEPYRPGKHADRGGRHTAGAVAVLHGPTMMMPALGETTVPERPAGYMPRHRQQPQPNPGRRKAAVPRFA